MMSNPAKPFPMYFFLLLRYKTWLNSLTDIQNNTLLDNDIDDEDCLIDNSNVAGVLFIIYLVCT